MDYSLSGSSIHGIFQARILEWVAIPQDALPSEPPGKPFIIGNWNAKVGSQEAPGVTDKFGLGVQNEAGQRLTEFHQENALVITNTLFQ